MRKAFTYSAGIVLIVGLIVVILMIYYRTLSPSITSDDVDIRGSVKPYDKNNFLVELHVVRLKDETAGHFVYPISKGLGEINFIAEEGYYAPGSVGDWPVGDKILSSEVGEAGNNLLGFPLPRQKGTYRLQFLLRKQNDFHGLKNIDMYYVHYEEKFGKDLSWIKKTEIVHQ